jgi:hypothetical protein
MCVHSRSLAFAFGGLSLRETQLLLHGRRELAVHCHQRRNLGQASSQTGSAGAQDHVHPHACTRPRPRKGKWRRKGKRGERNAKKKKACFSIRSQASTTMLLDRVCSVPRRGEKAQINAGLRGAASQS